MEEQVGALWHRLVTRMGERRYPHAAVSLTDMAQTLGIYFRALGGDGGLEVRAADATPHGARRGLWARLAGVGDRATLAWRDERALLLPPVIDRFADRALNRDLYLWLAALATGAAESGDDWLRGNQRLVRSALARFPGLQTRYRRLSEAHCAERPDPSRLPAAESAAERAIRQALAVPGSVDSLPAGRHPPLPVPLWLHPDPPLPVGAPLPGRRHDRAGPRPGGADRGPRPAPPPG